MLLCAWIRYINVYGFVKFTTADDNYGNCIEIHHCYMEPHWVIKTFVVVFEIYNLFFYESGSCYKNCIRRFQLSGPHMVGGMSESSTWLSAGLALYKNFNTVF